MCGSEKWFIYLYKMTTYRHNVTVIILRVSATVKVAQEVIHISYLFMSSYAPTFLAAVRLDQGVVASRLYEWLGVQ